MHHKFDVAHMGMIRGDNSIYLAGTVDGYCLGVGDSRDA